LRKSEYIVTVRNSHTTTGKRGILNNRINYSLQQDTEIYIMLRWLLQRTGSLNKAWTVFKSLGAAKLYFAGHGSRAV
jgi:hypothetical protein